MYIPITGFFYISLRFLSKITKVCCCQGRERRTKDFDVKKPSYLKSPIEHNSQRTGFQNYLVRIYLLLLKKVTSLNTRMLYNLNEVTVPVNLCRGKIVQF